MPIPIPPHNVLSPFHLDTLTASVVRGDLLVGNSTPKWSRLGVGTNALLYGNGTDAAWSSAPTLSGALTSLQSINATSTDGLVLSNTTAAVAGAQQWSPRLRLTGQGWKTNATAASQAVDWIIENQSVQGAANPTSTLVFSTQVNAAGYSARWALSSAGVATLSSAGTAGAITLSNANFDLIIGNASATASFRLLPFNNDIYFDNTAAGSIFFRSSTVQWLAISSTGIFTIGNVNDMFMSRVAAATLQFGVDVNGAAVSQILQACNGVTGTDKTGGNFTVASGKGTGAGSVSSLIFQTPTVLASGTTAQSLATRLTIASGSLTLADATDLVFGSTTGTKHGTATSQKQSFWNATPIVQPTTGVAAATFAANTSGILNDTGTWDGYTIGQVVKALRNIGLLA